MSLIAAFAATAIAAPFTQADAPVSSVRCRPAPYLVADPEEPSRPEKIFVTGSRVPMRPLDRKGRPCYLTRDGKVADTQTA
ncbi:MAG: hypothetical protein GC203_05890 [Phenylobacterium sp.]|uniref:hypothetical protein n=1 Tax=Phenylobacterium sp. TaxID=1871053 RepID=UPI0025EA6EF2|nr:hypothetical protein [Phenylobacterium sp.]MBI1197375.1 hypothetical protein [Phenylobacterium sp.]